MHRNAPLTPEGRLRLCQLIDEDGWTVAAAAESMRISRQTAHKWWRRYQDAGIAGLEDRSSRPRRCPTKTPDRVERRIVELRRRHQLGPARLGPEARHARLDLPPGTPAPRGEPALRPRPQGRSGRPPDRDHPSGRTRPYRREEAGQDPQGWWLAGQRTVGRLDNGKAGRPRLGFAYIHSAIDAYSRLAYSEIHTDERATTAIGFWRRARAFFASYGITVERVLTDNGGCYRAKDFTAELVSAGIKHRPSPGPTGPRPMEKLSASTGPCRTNGPMPGPTAQKPPEPEPWTPGSTCTTIIGTTPPSEDHLSVVSTTWLGRTL